MNPRPNAAPSMPNAFARSWGSVTSAMYRREFSDRHTSATLALPGSADGTFVVSGLPLARDTFVGRAGMTLRAGSGELSLMYEWRGARSQTRQALQLALGFK